MRLSVVTTMYKSAGHLPEFVDRMNSTAQKFCGDDFEIVLVNDGSPDNSVDVAKDLARSNSKIKVVDLSRNFGHHKAMVAGLSHAEGELIYLLDSDLEEAPEWLEDFSAKMTETNSDLVFGVQKSRKGGIFEKITGWVFYRLLIFLTGFSTLSNVVTARLMSRRYLKSFLQFTEREFSIAGTFLLAGYKQQSIEVKKLSLHPSTYSFRGKFELMIDSITSFSSKPLMMIFYLGLTVSSASVIGVIYLIYNRLALTNIMIGWTSLITSIWLIGGLVMMCMGVVGIYLSRVYMETKQRPTFIVKEVFKNSSE